MITRHALTPFAWNAVVGLLLTASASSCCKNPLDRDGTAKPATSAPGTTSATNEGAAATAIGPIAQIPAGTLVAGTPCQQTPRITNEEVEGERTEMGAFDIDVYPYPNDPEKPPKTNVSRSDADKLCKDRGRRLCTELEWERACKGPSNTTYPYGNSYRPKLCEGTTGLLRSTKSYDSCVSEFGVKSMFGTIWEWTSSDWGRGGAADTATVRGGEARNGALQSRCANGQGRPSTTSADDVGFRCCGGSPNTPAVNLKLDTQPVLTGEGNVDAALSSRLMAQLPASLRKVDGFEISFDRVWRWHPRANEELLVARYVGKSTSPAFVFYRPLVFHLCGNSTVLSSKLRGPVERMQGPSTASDAQQISIQVETGTDKGEVLFDYRYGNVTAKTPEWVKEANKLEPTRPKLPRLIFRTRVK